MEAIFKVRSMITEEDYKKYLRLITFRSKKSTIPLLILIPLLLSLVISYFSGLFKLKSILFLFLIFTFISFAVTFLKLFITYTRVKLMNTESLFDTYNNFYFYDDRLVSENEDIKGENTVKYISFYYIFESDEYFILYFSDFLVQIIRKKDYDQNEKLSRFLQDKLDKRYRKI